MSIPILAELERLVIEHGSAVIQEKHIALLREQIGWLEKQKGRLEKENARLSEDLSHTKRELERHITPSDYLEWKGVLIKRLPGGGHFDTPYCLTCKLPMSSVGPRKMLVCPHCGYSPHLNITAFRDYLSASL